MRTIAVFHAGTDAGEELWYCELADLAGKPVKGDSFVYNHSVYEVAKTYVVLGSRDSKGGLRSGTDKLLELLNAVFGEDKAVSLYARLRNIGSGDAPEVTVGGIFLPQAKLAGDFDDVVFCSVKSGRATSGGERGYGVLVQAVTRLHSSADAGAAAVANASGDLPAAGLKRIRLTDPDAAGDGLPENVSK